MASLGSILKSRDITLPTKARIVKTMVFPVAMYGCESWTKWLGNTEEGRLLVLLVVWGLYDNNVTLTMALWLIGSWEVGVLAPRAALGRSRGWEEALAVLSDVRCTVQDCAPFSPRTEFNSSRGLFPSAGHYDKCVFALREENKSDMNTVLNYIFSHAQVTKKNLLDQLCGRDPTLTDELINILTELTQLSKTTNAKVALRARQVKSCSSHVWCWVRVGLR
ncbi:Acetyl-CoA carboxylase 1 [Varanus komodoensis]|nr:Acetyl-CoA carboxylase 1 [Varanus komodoensis]